MSQSPTRREQIRQVRRKQILAAAAQVFASRGFHTATVSDVAAKAGVSQGTIYWYFESKEKLLEAVLLSFFEDWEQRLTTVLERYPSATGKLRALGQSMVGFCRTAEGLFTLFVEYWTSSPNRAATSQLWTSLLVQYKQMLVNIIDDGVQSGEFKRDDAASIAWAVMAAYDGLAAYIMLMPDLDLDAISQALVETLLNGLVA
jgi:AcrR family transcriptional regulator